jgi:putative glycerol-1-phosphate prenyltransferase
MFDVWRWQHVFKLDPDKTVTDEELEALCESGSDAIIVGGTQGVTFDNTLDLLARIRRYAIPCVLEVSNREAIVPGFDHYFIPFVLNAYDPQWMLEPHVEAVKELGKMIPWHDVTMIAYCVLNPEATVARLTRAKTSLSTEDIVAYGRLAYRLLNLSHFYLEYSGRRGEPGQLADVYQALKQENGLHLIYGGGIQNAAQAAQFSQAADTIVVGNVIYEAFNDALETIKGVAKR